MSTDPATLACRFVSAFYNAFKKGSQKKLLSKPDLASFAKMKHFDTIGEVHGQAGKLREATLLKMVLVAAVWLDYEGLRVVHAAWDQGMKDWLDTPALTSRRLALTASRNSEMFRCLDALLKGIEIDLPEGLNYSDREGHERSSIRIKWWIAPGTGFTYRSYVFPPSDVAPNIPNAPKMMHSPYPKSAPLVIFGHYWLPFDAPHSPLADNVACVDFSAGAEGPLVAYRWDGESQLDSAKFVFSD